MIKKYVIMIISIISVLNLLFSGCIDDNSSDPNKLIGAWDAESEEAEIFMIFHENNTGIFIFDNNELFFTYEIEENILTLSDIKLGGGDNLILEFSFLNDNVLKLVNIETNDIEIFNRVE